MANVNNPGGNASPNIAQALISAANELVPMVGALDAKGDAASLAQAAQLQNGITRTLNEAMMINAQSAIAVLQADAAALANVQKLTAQAQTAAAKIAQNEANVQSAIAFCTSVVTFGIAVTNGNVGGAATALGNILSDLKII